MTCSEMRDVWLFEILPKLNVIDVVRLSMVNHWARRIAHTIKQQQSEYTTLDSESKYRNGFAAWPHLRWKLELTAWKPEANTTAKWCDVALLVLHRCPVFDFSFVETRRLENFTLDGGMLNETSSNSFEDMLRSCTPSLMSLSLKWCVSTDDDDVKWLVNGLSHLTHLTHLSLHGDFLGARRMQQVCSVLCDLVQITSLDLRGNLIDYEIADYVCDCIQGMPNIQTLLLAYNAIGVEDAPMICTALEDKYELTHLDLFDNHLESDGVKQLLPCLAQLPKLSFLNVRNNAVDDAMHSLIRTELAHVKQLDL
eukprot:c12764_g1_i5.p1 GENE.c12764_g1_i5~~c12764_g1_i5.p1  ORF type:complete len:319 (-),score=80.24 c12764_g1_i5:211-1140(-)